MRARPCSRCLWAAALSEESLALRTAIGDTWGRATALHQLGTIAAEQGEHGRAIALYEESLSLRRKLGDRYGIAVCLEGLVGVAVAQDYAERAARLCGTAAALRPRIGAPVSPPERARYDRHVSAARAALGDAGRRRFSTRPARSARSSASSR